MSGSASDTLPQLLIGAGLGLAGAVGVAALSRSREARATLAWILRSWQTPADAPTRWQQRAGRRVDPLDRIRRGI